MKNNTIKIKAFLCLLLLMCGWVSVQAQQVLTVKGVVVDALKEPLPGASVQVVGMSTGTVTDLDGNFSLQVPKGKTIAVSFIGYVTQELTVNQNQSNLTIQLKDDSKQLNEVVVIGYGTVEKKDLTGSIQSVTSKELSKLVTTDVTETLNGRVGGVLVNKTSNRPGSDTKIEIRGINSFNFSNEPLYVQVSQGNPAFVLYTGAKRERRNRQSDGCPKRVGWHLNMDSVVGCFERPL